MSDPWRSATADKTACETGSIPPKLMTAQAVAEVLQVNQRTVRRWVAAGALRPIRLGATLRFRAADVEHLIERGFPKK
jgi:excisionase family DNA binding protein